MLKTSSSRFIGAKLLQQRVLTSLPAVVTHHAGAEALVLHT